MKYEWMEQWGDHPLRGGWWLLDAETSGFDPLTNDIISLRFAYMENYSVQQELNFLVQPKKLIVPWVTKLTGITPEQMKDAVPMASAVRRLRLFLADAPLLIYNADFLLPFLKIAFHQYDRDEFDFPWLSLGELSMAVLGEEKVMRLDQLAQTLPEMPGFPPMDTELTNLYRVAASVLMQLEKDSVRTVGDLLAWSAEVAT